MKREKRLNFKLKNKLKRILTCLAENLHVSLALSCCHKNMCLLGPSLNWLWEWTSAFPVGLKRLVSSFLLYGQISPAPSLLLPISPYNLSNIPFTVMDQSRHFWFLFFTLNTDLYNLVVKTKFKIVYNIIQINLFFIIYKPVCIIHYTSLNSVSTTEMYKLVLNKKKIEYRNAQFDI